MSNKLQNFNSPCRALKSAIFEKSTDMEILGLFSLEHDERLSVFSAELTCRTYTGRGACLLVIPIL